MIYARIEDDILRKLFSQIRKKKQFRHENKPPFSVFEGQEKLLITMKRNKGTFFRKKDRSNNASSKKGCTKIAPILAYMAFLDVYIFLPRICP